MSDPAPDVPAVPLRFVTVLMPVHNGDRYVEQAIESVLSQTHQRFEILIIDDGSTDRTPGILDGYARRDPRVRVVHQQNVDQPATLNRGLELARHDWVAILDHDDVCLPQRLQRQLEALAREPKARVIGTHAFEINADGARLRTRGRGPTSVNEFHTWYAEGQRVPLIHPSVLLHRPTILSLGGYDPEFGSSADSELWARVSARQPILVVPEPLILYRIHRESMSFERMFEQRERLRWITAQELARQSGDPVPSLESFRARRRRNLALRWGDLQQDLFWYFKSYCLLALDEGRRPAAAALAVCAAFLAPGLAIRRVRRAFSARLAQSSRLA